MAKKTRRWFVAYAPPTGPSGDRQAKELGGVDGYSLQEVASLVHARGWAPCALVEWSGDPSIPGSEPDSDAQGRTLAWRVWAGGQLTNRTPLLDSGEGLGDDRTLYRVLLDEGCLMDNHESDLYVPDTPRVRELLALYPTHAKNAKWFRVQDGASNAGETWVEVPFAYEPFWTASGRDYKHGP